METEIVENDPVALRVQLQDDLKALDDHLILVVMHNGRFILPVPNENNTDVLDHVAMSGVMFLPDNWKEQARGDFLGKIPYDGEVHSVFNASLITSAIYPYPYDADEMRNAVMDVALKLLEKAGITTHVGN